MRPSPLCLSPVAVPATLGVGSVRCQPSEAGPILGGRMTRHL